MRDKSERERGASRITDFDKINPLCEVVGLRDYESRAREDYKPPKPPRLFNEWERARERAEEEEEAMRKNNRHQSRLRGVFGRRAARVTGECIVISLKCEALSPADSWTR